MPSLYSYTLAIDCLIAEFLADLERVRTREPSRSTPHAIRSLSRSECTCVLKNRWGMLICLRQSPALNSHPPSRCAGRAPVGASREPAPPPCRTRTTHRPRGGVRDKIICLGGQGENRVRGRTETNNAEAGRALLPLVSDLY